MRLIIIEQAINNRVIKRMNKLIVEDHYRKLKASERRLGKYNEFTIKIANYKKSRNLIVGEQGLFTYDFLISHKYHDLTIEEKVKLKLLIQLVKEL